ncbi:hypothetical protein HUJ04_010808 [Dendroctonus ponderosae]|nr:hypothetical protein HUJ04_010808 [Dendroctonus ponderosae]
MEGVRANLVASGSPPSGSNPPNEPASTSPSTVTSPTRRGQRNNTSSGSRPTGGSTGSNSPTGSDSASNQSPPNGAAPPDGQPPDGLAPPLLGNIVAAPGWNQLPEPIDRSDSIVVSAEEIDQTANMFDRICEMYHSRVTRIPNQTPKSGNPVVMIFGGTNSEEKEFPHMAALGYGDPNARRWLCGGSLISENFVLTAAHCISTSTLGNVRYVKFGSLSEVQNSPSTQLRNVVRTTTYPHYDPVTHYNDIALIQLDKPVDINSYVIPICLFSSNNYEDRNVIATGWGKTESGSSSLTLQKVGLELFTQAECQEVYKVVSEEQLPLGIQQSIQLCAGSHSESKDTCQCGQVNVPGVYTRVAPYLPWIQQYIFK